MAINEKWLPVVTGAVSWIKNNIVPSRKELEVQIADLEKQVRVLADDNAMVINNMNLIIQAILSQIKTDSDFSVTTDAIIFIGENTGYINIPKTALNNSSVCGDIVKKKKVVGIDCAEEFFVSDEEIALTRGNKSRDRR